MMLSAQDARDRMHSETYINSILDNVKTSIENAIAAGLNTTTFIGSEDLAKTVTDFLVEFGYEIEDKNIQDRERLIEIRW